MRAKSTQLVRFLDSKYKTGWVKLEGKLEIYMRKSRVRKATLELANAVAKNPGTGALTEILPKIEVEAKSRGYEKVYIENAAPRVRSFLKRNGYVLVQGSEDFNDPFTCYEKDLCT